MRKPTYQTKLDQDPDCPKVSRLNASNDIITKNEKDINSTLLDMKKQELIGKKIHQKAMSTGAKPARRHDLAKVRKKDPPLRPFLSISDSPYHNLNNFLTPLFERVPGANIETSSLQAREKHENIELEKNEQISLDVKNLKK